MDLQADLITHADAYLPTVRACLDQVFFSMLESVTMLCMLPILVTEVHFNCDVMT